MCIRDRGLTDGKNYNVLAKTDVNWLDEVFSNAALLQNYELSVSGASEKTNYYVSGGYYSQDGTAVGSSFERYSIRANVEQRAAKWLKLGTNTMMNYQTIEKADDGEYTLTTPISAARFMLPYWNPHLSLIHISILNARGELVGVNFDRTWRSTMSDVAFDETICRNIAVDIRYVLFVIDRIGGAGYLFGEMDFGKRK